MGVNEKGECSINLPTMASREQIESLVIRKFWTDFLDAISKLMETFVMGLQGRKEHPYSHVIVQEGIHHCIEQFKNFRQELAMSRKILDKQWTLNNLSPRQHDESAKKIALSFMKSELLKHIDRNLNELNLD
jgi:hypothetical protein